MNEPSITATNKRLLAIIKKGATPQKKLSALKGIIQTQHHQVQKYGRATVEAAVDLGAMLLEARKLVIHGKWEKWVTSNCEFTPRYANDLIKLSVYFQGLAEVNRKLTSDLTVTAAIAMARQKVDPAKFDAEAFAAVAKDAPPDDTDDEPPWATEPESNVVAFRACKVEPPPVELATPNAGTPKPATPPPPPPAVRPPVTIEGEYRHIAVPAQTSEAAVTPAPSITPQPDPSPEPAPTIAPTREPLPTPKELLHDAAKLLRALNGGRKPDAAVVCVWVASYDALILANQLAAMGGNKDDDWNL